MKKRVRKITLRTKAKPMPVSLSKKRVKKIRVERGKEGPQAEPERAELKKELLTLSDKDIKFLSEILHESPAIVQNIKKFREAKKIVSEIVEAEYLDLEKYDPYEIIERHISWEEYRLNIIEPLIYDFMLILESEKNLPKLAGKFIAFQRELKRRDFDGRFVPIMKALKNVYTIKIIALKNSLPD